MSVKNFDAKQARSLMADDVDLLRGLADALRQACTGSEFFPMDAEVTIASKDGYVLGSVWWDAESEVWRLDPKRYGEAV